MLVHYNNQLWELDMPYLLFESLKTSNPNYNVNLLEQTNSSYKKEETTRIGDVEDYSIVRNMNALKR